MKARRMRKHVLLFICALVVSLGGCNPAGGPGLGRSDAEIRAGAAHLRNGRKTQALRAFDRAVALSPSDVETYMVVTGLLTNEEMYEESITYISRGIARPRPGDSRPDLGISRLWDSELYTTLGDVYYHLNRIAEAEDAYRQAILLNKNNASACNNWGYMYADLGVRLDKSLRLTKHAVDLEPGNGCFVDSVGWAYFQKSDTGNAVKCLRRAVDLRPSDPEIRYHLGRAYEAAGNTEAALLEYRKALKLSTSHEPARERIRYLRSKSS